MSDTTSISYYDKYGDSELDRFDEDEHIKIRKLLLGRKVEVISDDHMKLDDGTVILIDPNEGCGACSSGWYELDQLNECDNIITSVEFETGEHKNRHGEEETIYRVFVVAEDKRINLYAVAGDDGNGYYGTGYVLYVRYPKEGTDDE